MINLEKRIPNIGNIHAIDTIFNQINDRQVNQDGSFRFNNSMITGMNKDTKLNEEPYTSMFAKCRMDYLNPQEIWIIGYSFTDKHINSILKCLSYSVKKIRIVNYIPYSPDSFSYEDINPFINYINDLFRGSFIENRKHPKFNTFSNAQPVDNNIWYYRWDKTEVEIDLNGVVSFFERIEKEWEIST